MALQEYKCPCCNGAIAFDTGLQKMKCPYCDTEFEMENLKAYDEALKADGNDDFTWQSPERAWEESEEEGLRRYVCASCGGEILGDATLAATACPYCDNPTIIMHQFSGELKPDIVIPFKLDKKAAKQAMLNHFKGKRLLPKAFKSEQHIDEIKGVYVPFWLFDASLNGNFRYRGTRLRTWSLGDYIYTETSHFSLIRGGSIAFSNVPVDGSKKMADELMESLEPYELSAAVDFQTAYLAGFFADRYDIDDKLSAPRANQRVRRSAEQAFMSTTNEYSSVRLEHSDVSLSNGKAKYALLPVWILNTAWKGEKYVFAMNGQTGKLVGDLPVDKAAYRRWLFGITGAVGGALFLLAFLLWLI